eukprot:scaffold261343_cov42-Prasinocladus_malaysianus.AAC.1
MLRTENQLAALEWLVFAAEPWHVVLLAGMPEPERRSLFRAFACGNALQRVRQGVAKLRNRKKMSNEEALLQGGVPEPSETCNKDHQGHPETALQADKSENKGNSAVVVVNSSAESSD